MLVAVRVSVGEGGGEFEGVGVGVRVGVGDAVGSGVEVGTAVDGKSAAESEGVGCGEFPLQAATTSIMTNNTIECNTLRPFIIFSPNNTGCILGECTLVCV